MTEHRPRTLPLLPIACALSATDGRAQLDAWRLFDADYLLATENRGTTYIAQYAKVPDSEERLARLVEQETTCCSFVNWSIEHSDRRLRLVVTGTRDAISALGIR